ncbi:MAG: CHAT domain-containing protein [Lachnospiraceae bacterium]|nr:CHAT domain-containing protein [Lachnospiraceae bacterium]
MEHLFYLLKKGCEYVDLCNLQKGCEYFSEARKQITKIYGNNSDICNIVNLFDFIWEAHNMSYKKAALKLADAGGFIENFSEQNIIDDFTKWIYENKDDFMTEAISQTLYIFSCINPSLNFNIENLFLQLMLTGNDMEETINRTMIDPLGLPRKFHYFVEHICKDTLLMNNSDIKNNVTEIIVFMKEMQSIEVNSLNETKKIEFAKKIYELMGKSHDSFQKYMPGKGMSRFISSAKQRSDYDFVRGMLKNGDSSFAEQLLNKIKEKDITDITSQINMMLIECYIKYEQKDSIGAEKILDNILEIENYIVTQVFFIREEHKRIEFLNGLEDIVKRIAYLCYKIRGSKEAYSLIIRTRTLSFDRSVINLSSIEHSPKVLRFQQIEELEKEGADVSLEKSQLIAYLEKASGGIFSLDSIDICRKLLNDQAILEFALMTDLYDTDFYYVFVVTKNNIVAIELGKCNKIDQWLEELERFILDYAYTKHSNAQIKMSSAYYNMYKEILVPIGEVLTREIHSFYLAVTGKFIHIPFGLLPSFYWYDSFMESEYNISYINSGKEILYKYNGDINKEAVVIGNPDFGGKYPVLPASYEEAKAVANILGVVPITGKDAIPGCLRKPAGIFHICTHSFDLHESGLLGNDDPMDQAGLVFADGQLLTIREISQMDLTGTKLVVLSVCGIKEENLYNDVGPGIRRAFINAGVRYIILNLWKTDDYATELFMKCFYDNYINKNMSLGESLRKSKSFLRNSTAGIVKKSLYYDENTNSVIKYIGDNEIPYAHPYYWAGFIIIGV